MTMHKALHLWGDVDRLYVTKKGGGIRLDSIEDSIDTSIQWLKKYIEKHDIRNDTDTMMDNKMTVTRKQKWEEKQLYGYFKLLINNLSHEKTWTWVEKETESLQISAQNNAIRTNHIKARIDKMQQNINLIISKCSKLAQKEYKNRYDWVSQMIQWEMCKKYKFDHMNK